ncbi:MAG: potassium-transporting ATPase subunit KdpC [Armatimonadota bacterium]
MGRHTSIAIRMALVTMVVLGILYPLVMTGLAQLLFSRQANGSLVRVNGKLIGSELIGQQFADAAYFQSRPSAAGKGYDAVSSGGSNLGPTSKVLLETIADRSKAVRLQNPAVDAGQVPVDMVTASGSGLDPDISVANAYAQVPRVAKARGTSAERVKQLVTEHITQRELGFLGEPRVNVLRINLALDEAGQMPK